MDVLITQNLNPLWGVPKEHPWTDYQCPETELVKIIQLFRCATYWPYQMLYSICSC